jgi:hypothetical protein
MIKKFPVCPEKVRKVPERFSWVDQRLIRDGHINRLSRDSAALYLFLVTVADALGLSYYSDGSVCERLSMDVQALEEARRKLVATGLLAYKKPIYQVLSLEPPDPPKVPSACEPRSIGQILQQMKEHAP